jgi:hypothetical protein
VGQLRLKQWCYVAIFASCHAEWQRLHERFQRRVVEEDLGRHSSSPVPLEFA